MPLVGTPLKMEERTYGKPNYRASDSYNERGRGRVHVFGIRQPEL
jgi:hypothetical protein